MSLVFVLHIRALPARLALHAASSTRTRPSCRPARFRGHLQGEVTPPARHEANRIPRGPPPDGGLLPYEPNSPRVAARSWTRWPSPLRFEGLYSEEHSGGWTRRNSWKAPSRCSSPLRAPPLKEEAGEADAGLTPGANGARHPYQIEEKRIFTERVGLRRSRQSGHRNGLVAQRLPEGK